MRLAFILKMLKIYLVPLSFNYNVSQVQQQRIKTWINCLQQLHIIFTSLQIYILWEHHGLCIVLLLKAVWVWVLPFQSCLSGVSSPRLQRQRSRTCWIRSSVHELCSVFSILFCRGINIHAKNTQKINHQEVPEYLRATPYYSVPANQ